MTEIPMAIFYAKRRKDKIWDLVVNDCPFCHKKHTHGGGDKDSLNLSNGYRESHCFRGVYKLVEEVK